MSDVTRQDIIDGIRSLGVEAGDLLLVHSSLRSFGRVEGGARAVADALIASVGPTGTLILPTFNYGQLPYDPATTQSLTGAITDAFWRMPGVLRSRHPTHSFAAAGPMAAGLLAGDENVETFGRGSPLWRVHQRNGWVLLIGCDHRVNSVIHLAEEGMHVPYLGRTRVAHVLRGNEVRDVIVRQPGCSSGFNVVDEPLRNFGMIRQTRVGSSTLTLMRAGDVFAVACGLLARDPAALLCDRPDCDRCAWARERIVEHSRSA